MPTFFSSRELWVKWVISGGIFVLFLLLAFVSKYILGFVARIFTKKTKTIIDDLIVEALTVPIYIYLIVAGLWIGITRLPEVANYVDNINKGFLVIFWLITGFAISRITHALLTWYSIEIAPRTKSDFDDRLIPLLKRVADVIIYSITLLLALDQLHVNISPLLASLGIGGLAVALALQPTLSNFLSGTYVISDSIIRKGDYIQLDSGLEGTVEEIGWRITRIRSWQGNLVILPNSKLSDAVVTDFEKPETSMLFAVDGGVSYSSDLDKVEQVVTEVAADVMKNFPEGGKDFTPVVRFKNFGDSNINFSVVLKAENRGASFVLKHHFIKALHKRFQNESIVMEFPARKLYFEGKPDSGMFHQSGKS
jgi:small-conductance mechanosensitive channel